MTVWAPSSQASKVLVEVTKSRVLRTAGLLWALNLTAVLINDIKPFVEKKNKICVQDLPAAKPEIQEHLCLLLPCPHFALRSCGEKL